MDRISRLKGVFFGLVVVVLSSVFSPVMADTCTGTSQAQAYATCMSSVQASMAAYDQNRNPRGPVCTVGDGSCASCYTNAYAGYFTQTIDGVDSRYSAGQFFFSCPGEVPPANPCTGHPPMTYNQQGQILSGSSTCMKTPIPGGGSVQCGVRFEPEAQPMQNPYGHWGTYGTLSYSGDVCGGTGDDGNSWKNADGSRPADQPPPPPATPPTADPPKLCGGESCYDPKANQYCAQGDSGQICVPAPPASGASGGSCASGGDATICAGSPQAPKPPPAKVPDPPTQTQGTDNYTAANPTTGDKYNTTVTTYTTGPGSTSSGASSGDTQPAHSSSSGGGSGDGDDTKGDKTSASGGGDCSNPPHVEGNAALDLIARQTWLVRCDGGDSNDADKTLPGLADGVPDSAGTSAGVKDGGALLDRLDFSGLVGGGATCPQPLSIDIPEWGFSYHTAPDTWCTVLNALGLILMFAAAYRAFCVVGGN